MFKRKQLLCMPCVFLLHIAIVFTIPNFVNSSLQDANVLCKGVQVVKTENSDILLKTSENLFSDQRNVYVMPTYSPVYCDTNASDVNIIYKNYMELLVSSSDLNLYEHNVAYLCLTFDHTDQPCHLGLQSQITKARELRRRDVSFPSNNANKQINSIRITGLRVENSQKPASYSETVPVLIEKTKATLRLFGTGFNKNMIITFAISTCEAISSREFPVLVDELSEYSALVEIVVPDASTHNYHICAKSENNILLEQPSDNWLIIISQAASIPLWLTIVIISVCLAFSALFSGLNLGLMALDKTELKILINTGNKSERKYAKKIQPVRNHGNYLLCSILLGNVLVNATNATLMGGLTSGLIAVVASTLLIVIFGEIVPQALCSRHGLAVGANTIYITKFLMLLTAPFAYPLSKLLDYILGEEIGNVYNATRLKELVRVTNHANDLDKDEVNIISGALDMRKKTVAEIMTHIDDVFMLSYDAIMDFETVSEVMKSGFSRIPVYEGTRQNVKKLLLIKDLALIDPDDNIPLRTLCEFYQNYCYFVSEDTTLDVVFKEFKAGHHGHLAFVRRMNKKGSEETIGVITLEDVIEEVIQAEIMDETDIYTDNRSKTKRKVGMGRKQDNVYTERRENQGIRISPQLKLATVQYLSTYVDAFKPDNISETILNRLLLNHDIIKSIKCKGKDKNDASLIIYQQGKPVDYFVLILEGRVEVTAGKENMTFESGPFTFFGSQSLSDNVGAVESSQDIRGSLHSLNVDTLISHSIAPDYSVKAITDVLFTRINRNLYLAAKRATLMERLRKTDEHGSNEPIEYESEIF